jgi:hypothetical protein
LVLIENVQILDAKARIVAATKTLHHLLPDLVPPINREYTGDFFKLKPTNWQDRQRQTFLGVWNDLAEVAAATRPSRVVSEGWNTSPT